MDGEREVYRGLLAYAAASFLILPLLITFSEPLTRLVETALPVEYLEGVLAPLIASTVAGVLEGLGISTAVSGSYLYLEGWIPLRVHVNWSCVGWQSLGLLGITLAVGLRGPYTLRSRLMAAVIGVEGVFFVNILRIVITCLLAYYAGYLPALIFHDYFGTILTLLWLALFWLLAYSKILVEREVSEEKYISEESEVEV
ncbi:MAG: Exosortase EpsH-related protein [Candidatus Bathyarchaeota archaeon B23]|nr:MAG: Exosortase EpsH-related protein [Candidatus Bathyarchaeota archaeon B23]